MEDELVGLATYATNSTLDEQLTPDLSIISGTVNRLNASGFTAIGSGMRDGIRVLDRGRGAGFVKRR